MNTSRNATRVLIVVDRLSDRAGAEGSTALLVRHLQGSGFDFTVLTVGGSADVVDRLELEARGVAFHQVDRSVRSGISGVRWAIESVRPDLVHAVLFQSELVARLAAYRRLPVLGSIVNTQYSPVARSLARSPWKLEAARQLDGFLARHATAHFHAVSEFAAQEASRSLGVRPDQVTVIRRGRDDTQLGCRSTERRGHVREKLGLALEAPVAIAVARHEPQKRLDLLVEGFGEVVRRRKDAVLLVAGREGSATAALRTRVDSRGLSQHVRILGERDDVSDLLVASDVLMFSSAFEGLPGAVIEALALELPVVAFDVPTVREAVGGAGVLVPDGDADALGGAVTALVDDQERSRELGRLGRVRYRAMFTLDRYVAEFADLYRRVAGLQA